MNDPNVSTKELARIALDANINLQILLTKTATKLESQLKQIDDLLDGQEEAEFEIGPEVTIPGSKRATGLFPSSEFLNPLSPFFENASRRNHYIMHTHPRPMKEKDLEVLADAVKNEYERWKALHRSTTSVATLEPETSLNTINIDALNWDRIAEKVSDSSSVKRTATDCRVTWFANRPGVNRSPWTTAELQNLHTLVSNYPHNEVNWVEIAEKLSTNRIPIDCMRQMGNSQRHYWTSDADQRLMTAVGTFGINNWPLVAREVDEHVTPTQCQARWCKVLDPSLRRGAWSEEEDRQLRKAVAGFGTSWIQVATAVPGRTNDQCRERWTEHLNVGPQQPWTEEEDNILMAVVAEFGVKWKEVSSKVGGKKTSQACRRRYDKLKKAQKVTASLPPTVSTSNSVLSVTSSISSAPAEPVTMDVWFVLIHFRLENQII